MSQRERPRDRVHLQKVLITFLAGGLASGVGFGWFVTREELRNVWFVKQGIFVSPTWRFWVFTSLIFFFAQTASWTLSYVNGWLPFQVQSCARAFMALLLFASLPVMLHSPVLSVPILGSFLIAPVVVASFLSLALFGITGKWQGRAASGIMLASFVITPLANIPDAIMGSPGRVDVFEAVRFLIGSSLLSMLTGYWIAKSAAVDTQSEAH